MQYEVVCLIWLFIQEALLGIMREREDIKTYNLIEKNKEKFTLDSNRVSLNRKSLYKSFILEYLI